MGYWACTLTRIVYLYICLIVMYPRYIGSIMDELLVDLSATHHHNPETIFDILSIVCHCSGRNVPCFDTQKREHPNRPRKGLQTKRVNSDDNTSAIGRQSQNTLHTCSLWQAVKPMECCIFTQHISGQRWQITHMCTVHIAMHIFVDFIRCGYFSFRHWCVHTTINMREAYTIDYFQHTNCLIIISSNVFRSCKCIDLMHP